MEDLGISIRRVNEMWMRRTELTREFVQRVMSNKHARWHIDLAVLGVQFFDRGTPAGVVAFAKDLLKIAIKQFVDTVTHEISPFTFGWQLPAPLCLRVDSSFFIPL